MLGLSIAHELSHTQNSPRVLLPGVSWLSENEAKSGFFTQERPVGRTPSRELTEKEGENMTYKRGGVYWYKFMWQGQSIRESTKQGNDKVARQMEAAHRTSLAKGEVGIREKKPTPLLKDYLKADFLPFAATKHSNKPLTLRYYRQGCEMLIRS